MEYDQETSGSTLKKEERENQLKNLGALLLKIASSTSPGTLTLIPLLQGKPLRRF